MADDGAARAASSSSSPAPWVWATSSLSEGMYDVFLSFRGKDSRFNFTDYLYHGLADVKKLQVFRDYPGLDLGDKITTLMEAIKRSRIHIVVITENYVSSQWCLRELHQMLKFSDNGKKRPVIPIFYHVKPSEVRFSDKSKEAMEKHKERGEEADAWSSALNEICGSRGEHIFPVTKTQKYETEVIDKIAEQVSAKLQQIKQQLNRFDSQFKAVKSLLNLESCDTVCVVGIYEDPKVGKSYITTFAFELYYKIKHKFQAAGFLVDVSKFLRKTTDNHLENLKKELLDDIGVETMHELEHKKMLLVLEGVDSKEHVELLVEMRISDWFGGGSRILIATENRNLFQDCPPEMKGVKLEKHCIREGELVKEKIVKEKKVVGFVKEFIDVINQLKEEDSERRNVVSIVGMGGSGKTTLAGMIYDSNEVSQVFPCRAWATVSKQCIEKKVYRNLLESLNVSKSEYEKLSKVELKKKVRECLNGQSGKYLIVLDDVWDKEAWNKLKHLLPQKNNGSRILMTTRNDRVANYATSKEPHHQLGPLDEEESWELFRSEVFGGEECPSDLERIGKSIAKSCKGLPLAVATIAGVVRKRKRSTPEWESIEKLIPHWCDDEDIKRMMKILQTSYDDLSPELKPCFLYLGVFPEDYPIKVREIIRLWITEGFIEVRETGTLKAPPQPEDIGEDYLKELVDRNLVQVSRRRRSDGEGVKTFRIHDLFRDLCISESNKEEDDNTKSNINSRRLSFTRNASSFVCSAKSNQSKSICSLFVYAIDFDWPSGILDNTQSVNVLYVDIFGGRAPSVDLEELIHLMYLKIDGPPEVPIRIGEFKQMRHLRSQGCVQLQVDREGPRDILQNLQSLCYVRADSVLATLIENGCFPNLKTLGLVLYPEDKQGGGRTEELRRLRGLSNLHNLKLKFDHTKHIHWPALPIDTFEFVSKLTKITLVVAFGFNSNDMAALGRIDNLQILKLDQGASTETLDCGDAGSFPKLQVFMIDMLNLECISLKEGVMPCLQRVVISYCRHLREIPERLLSLSNLRHLHDDIWEEADNASNKYELRRTPTSS